MNKLEKYLSQTKKALLHDSELTWRFDKPTCEQAEERYEKLFARGGRIKSGLYVAAPTGIFYAKLEMGTVTHLDEWLDAPDSLQLPVLVKNPFKDSIGLGNRNGLVLRNHTLFVSEKTDNGWRIRRPLLPGMQDTLQEGYTVWLQQVKNAR